MNTPIGEGKVDFHTFFKQVKNYGVRVPAILHLEYPLGGAEHGPTSPAVDPDRVFDAMRRDLKTIR